MFQGYVGKFLELEVLKSHWLPTIFGPFEGFFLGETSDVHVHIRPERTAVFIRCLSEQLTQT